MVNILSITGSDNSGWSGLQLDLRVITDIGCHALTTATSIVVQNSKGIQNIIDFPLHVIAEQLENTISGFHPKAIKVGLVRTAESAKAISSEIVACNKIVIAPGFMASNNAQLVDNEAILAIKQYLIPKATLLLLRQNEAEKILDTRISSDNDLLCAGQKFINMGAEYVMIRGGKITEGRLTALLLGRNYQQFFSSYNVEGWQQHGVGGALSTAITAHLGMGEDVPAAVHNAHEYVHSRIVYSVNNDSRKLRPADIYNTFMNLLSNHYQSAHDVIFYADKLNISTRYLSQITAITVSKTPKQIILEYLLHETKKTLENTRLSVKEVAASLGFANIAQFCRFFRQQTGITPNEYRKSV